MPLFRALRAYLAVLAGVLCAEDTVISNGMENSSRARAASSMTERSESLPISMPTIGLADLAIGPPYVLRLP
jgi:hypothetical protein